MIILHASYAGEKLHLWGEVSLSDADESKPISKKSLSRKKSTEPTRLIYDAGYEELCTGLSKIVTDVQIKKADVIQSLIWIPTIDNHPIPSNSLIDQTLVIRNNISPELALFTVTAIELRTAYLLDLLCKCGGRDMIAPGVLVGSDIAWWGKALQFAGMLLAQGKFLPTLIRENGSHYARWEPIFSGDDFIRLSRLSQSMPHSCRAITEKGTEPVTISADFILKSFLKDVVDHLVRYNINNTSNASDKTQKNFGIHDHWLHALRDGNGNRGQLKSSISGLNEMVDTVRTWRRPIDVSLASPFKLCFRIEEPLTTVNDISEVDFLPIDLNKSKDWYLRYLLQASDDPSLIIPVSDSWKPKKNVAEIFKLRSFNSREYLLSALGQASALDSEIEGSLRSSAPDGYDMDATGAHTFLTEKAFLLEQSGFPVMLPAWWAGNGKRQRLRVKAKAKSVKLQGKPGITMDQIIKFDWEAALGDRTLTIEELEALAALKAPLVKMRGQWIHLSPEEIQALIELKSKKSNKATLRELIQMSLGKIDIPGNLDFEGVVADGWIDELLSKLSGRKSFEELSQPENLKGTLRPYQVRGYSWLTFLRQTGLGACLADDMGLGKTIQALSLILSERSTNSARPTLLICPTSVIGNWQKETARFAPDLSLFVHHGAKRIKGADFKKHVNQYDMVISSYSLLQRDFEMLKEVNWGGVILDEAQNIKNADTKQSQAARKLDSEFRIALTGTPVENNVGDLWAIMEFLNPGFLGSLAAFKRNYFLPIQIEHDKEAIDNLKRLTAPFILRRLKTDKSIITDLPEKMEMKVYCTLTKEQASLYAAVVEDTERLLEEAIGIQRRGIILATLMKLKQVCNHPVQFLADKSKIEERSGKLSRLTEMLEEALSNGDKALIFTQFAEMGKIIQRRLQEHFGQEALFLHGAVQKKHRDTMVERFQSTEETSPKIFILSLKAGGTGLNLTAANHVFHYDRWWNPAVENQATDRAFRIGQTRNVQVHKFICAGTLEDKIDEMIERKLEISSKIVGTGEGWITELSNNQLKELFKLRKEAAVA